MNLLENIKYYLWASYRRKMLDTLLEKNQSYYNGTVIDIGGRSRGKFKKPLSKISKWIFADIEPKHNPDVILDVTDMKHIKTESVNTVKSTELFEHVSYPEKGISECYRIIKFGGIFIISMPFLYGLHADPCDYQRWTEHKLKLVLESAGFKIIKFEKMGGFFTISADMIKNIFNESNIFLKYLSFFFYPLLDLFVKLDNIDKIKKSVFGKYVGGYFIIATK